MTRLYDIYKTFKERLVLAWYGRQNLGYSIKNTFKNIPEMYLIFAISKIFLWRRDFSYTQRAQSAGSSSRCVVKYSCLLD